MHHITLQQHIAVRLQTNTIIGKHRTLPRIAERAVPPKLHCTGLGAVNQLLPTSIHRTALTRALHRELHIPPRHGMTHAVQAGSQQATHKTVPRCLLPFLRGQENAEGFRTVQRAIRRAHLHLPAARHAMLRPVVIKRALRQQRPGAPLFIYPSHGNLATRHRDITRLVRQQSGTAVLRLHMQFRLPAFQVDAFGGLKVNLVSLCAHEGKLSNSLRRHNLCGLRFRLPRRRLGRCIGPSDRPRLTLHAALHPLLGIAQLLLAELHHQKLRSMKL